MQAWPGSPASINPEARTRSDTAQQNLAFISERSSRTQHLNGLSVLAIIPRHHMHSCHGAGQRRHNSAGCHPCRIRKDQHKLWINTNCRHGQRKVDNPVCCGVCVRFFYFWRLPCGMLQGRRLSGSCRLGQDLQRPSIPKRGQGLTLRNQT